MSANYLKKTTIASSVTNLKEPRRRAGRKKTHRVLWIFSRCDIPENMDSEHLYGDKSPNRQLEMLCGRVWQAYYEGKKGGIQLAV